MPRIGELNLAQIIGEVGPILERAETFEQFAAETGLAPVTRASGKTHTVAFRHATNRHARQALVLWIDNSRRATLGRNSATLPPEAAGNDTQTPAARSDAHGCASSGPAGVTDPAMTPHCT